MVKRDEVEQFYISAGPQLRAIANELRAIDKRFPGQLRTALRKVARGVQRDVQAAALELPAHGVKHTGLRDRLAAGVGIRTSVGARAGVRFTTSMPPGQEMLPRGEDSGVKGWRHPVFETEDQISARHGAGATWVHQDGSSWFRETIANDRPEFQDAFQAVIDDAVAKIHEADEA